MHPSAVRIYGEKTTIFLFFFFLCIQQSWARTSYRYGSAVSVMNDDRHALRNFLPSRRVVHPAFSFKIKSSLSFV